MLIIFYKSNRKERNTIKFLFPLKFFFKSIFAHLTIVRIFTSPKNGLVILYINIILKMNYEKQILRFLFNKSQTNMTYIYF